jgi:tetratricopeptide (TPR) repeat protein
VEKRVCKKILKQSGSIMKRMWYFGFMLTILIVTQCKNDLIEMGSRNLALGDYNRAIVLFSKAVDSDPESYNARLGLGKSLLQQIAALGNSGDELWNSCLINLEVAETLKPGSGVDTILSIAWYQRAQVLVKRRDTTMALHALMRSIQLDGKNVKTLNTAGILYFGKGERSKAYSMFSLAMQLDSLSITGPFNCGLVAWSEDDCPNALGIWRHALQRFPDDRELLYWTALAEKTCGGRN